ncbi:MAG: HigA family addiction module antitoxin [Kiloniellales bacterium]|nr:HigA family addiction module antitoxin [Kiloniellales bacterium]
MLRTPDNRITTHPGEVLKEEFLVPLGMSANKLAQAIGVPANRVTTILHGRRNVTPDTALRLARFFGTTPEFWMNLQASHDLSKAKIESAADINKTVRPMMAKTV